MSSISSKILPTPIKTKHPGIYYKEIQKTSIDDHGNIETKIIDKIYIIRYRDNGKARFVTIGKYSQGIRETYCKAKRDEYVILAKNGELPPAIEKRKKKAKGITVDDVFDFYIKGKDMTDRSRKDFKGRYNKHLRDSIGNIAAHDITAEQIIEVRSDIDGSLKTKEMLVQILGSAFNYSIVNKYPDIVNPINRVRALDRANQSKNTKKRKRTKREEYLKRDELKQLRKAIRNDCLSLLAVEILLSTGVRVGGALTIQKKHIDLKEGTINLIDHKSGDVSYTGYISRRLKVILENHLEKLERNDYVLSLDGIETPYKRIARPLKKVFDELFNEGLDAKDSKNRIVLHSLRHTFATHLALKNVPIYTIKDLLHHTDISMTMRYAHFSKEAGQNAVRKLKL